MISGITIEDIKKGTGKEALKSDYVLIECLFFLNQGDKVEIFTNYNKNQFVVYLNSRDTIPGLIKGIVGMHEGGERKIRPSVW